MTDEHDLKATVLICTRNNARSLRHTINSIRRCDAPGASLAEVLVVDNGSTDGTATLVRSIGSTWPKLKYVHESRPGKGYAYNAGIARAAGSVVFFTDDDVRVPEDWIERQIRILVRRNLDGLAGGVRVDARYERWMRRAGVWDTRAWFALTDMFAADRVDGVVAANMVIRREALTRNGRFDCTLGPGGLGFGDETEYFLRLRQNGMAIGTAYDSQVVHKFRLTRLRYPALVDLAKRRGDSSGYVQWHYHRKRIDPKRWWVRWVDEYPKRCLLPLMQPIWRGAIARRLHQIRTRTEIARNQLERIGG